MSILVNEDSRVVVQGITGHEGSFHTSQMIEYGTNIVGGVTPEKGGLIHLGRPVFNTVSEAVKVTGADVSVIFVPPPLAADAILEAADAGIRLIVCITEGIPVKDMISVMDYLRCHNVRMIGPNCPGIITPPHTKIGIMPGFIHKPGTVGIVSRSGTLTYEAVDQISKIGLGQSTGIGVGGDPIPGTKIIDVVQLFMEDPDTEGIVMIGEIGGNMETDAGYWIQQYGTKPVVSFIAGATAPKGRTMGHAGAIIGGKSDTAEAKKEILRQCGIHVVDSPADIGTAMWKALNP
ncbi:MAG: succinate--CoA ligase subunit alpha [Bacteroidales bacterium]|nr:succinate--CoA ligase subunit alpha [Bacteroidales bacterium]MDD4603323.1 succinate--CoA ligase subunit alpha [Bacteroidales bacterium]